MAALLLRSGSGDRAELGTALEAEAGRVWELLSGRPGARVRVLEMIDGAVDGTSHALSMGGRPFDAEIEAGWDDAPLAELVDVFAGLAGRLGDRLDAADSYAQVGTVYPFTPRETDVVTLVVISRPLTMSWDAHHRHWLDEHGWVVKPGADARGSGYRQFHADPKASSFAARSAGLGRHEYEGFAAAYFDDMEAYRAVMVGANPKVLEDEARFIDMTDSAPGVYRITTVHED
ncbi:EthD domain-containing protein [Modestobacter sp. NPDC049651]|uniref:EthD domain-containing protein n=1 Tax=unclassified Modestobacter TaxID=2643866 RepID=UPI0033CBE73F